MDMPTSAAPCPGETCTCGRPATIVYLTDGHDAAPYCGAPIHDDENELDGAL